VTAAVADRSPARAAARLGRALLLVAIAWLVAVAATWWYVERRVDASYERSLSRARAQTRIFTALFNGQVEDSLGAADAATRMVAGGGRLRAEVARALLGNLRAGGDARQRVSVTDARGVVIASSEAARIGSSLSRRAEFAGARAQRDGGEPIVGKPLAVGAARVATIPLVRRLSRPDGGFDGVIEVLIEAEPLVRHLEAVDLGATGVVALLDREGAVYARSGRGWGSRGAGGAEGSATSANDVIQAVLARARVAAADTFVQTDDAGHALRVVSFRRVGTSGLVVLVGQSADVILEQHALFRGDWVVTGGVITGLVSLVGMLAIVYLRHEQRSARALAQAFAREHANARTDPLTGLPNRRAFIDLLRAQIEYHRRRGEPLSIAYFDCDRFKAVNDRFGHEAGDRCLLLVGSVLAEGLRRSDYPCRIGGDEFAALFPSTRSADAALVMERLRARLARELGAEGFPVTASIGVIEVTDFDADPEELLTEVDGAMYQAKRAGGNRVVAMPSSHRRKPMPALTTKWPDEPTKTRGADEA